MFVLEQVWTNPEPQTRSSLEQQLLLCSHRSRSFWLVIIRSGGCNWTLGLTLTPGLFVSLFVCLFVCVSCRFLRLRSAAALTRRSLCSGAKRGRAPDMIEGETVGHGHRAAAPPSVQQLLTSSVSVNSRESIQI